MLLTVVNTTFQTLKLWRGEEEEFFLEAGSYADGNNTGTSLIQYFKPLRRRSKNGLGE
jgi:hypothetical protein